MAKPSICIDVAEMEKGIQFYTEALELVLVKRGEEHTELSADGICVYLSEKAAGSNALLRGQAHRDYSRHWTPVHLDFNVDDLDQCVSRIIAMGGSKEGENRGDWGAIAFCADPFGNGFCVMQTST